MNTARAHEKHEEKRREEKREKARTIHCLATKTPKGKTMQNRRRKNNIKYLAMHFLPLMRRNAPSPNQNACSRYEMTYLRGRRPDSIAEASSRRKSPNQRTYWPTKLLRWLTASVSSFCKQEKEKEGQSE